MKSEHRHQLETNVLAKRLDVLIDRFRPYAATIAGVLVAAVVIMFLWSYLAGSSAARRREAWDAYNLAVTERTPNVDRLRLAAEEHPGTKMQQMADITWADSQVLLAARDYIYNRSAAMEALDRAASRYQGVLQSADEERLLNRAQLGMARIYEIRGELEKARDEYLKVKGAYQEYAKAQAERLAKPEAQETYAWLATAQPPRPAAPSGPGTPGQRPDFSAGELALPGDGPETGSPATTPEGESFENLLEGLKLDFGEPGDADRYAPGETAAGQEESMPAEGQSPAGQEEAPPAQQETPPLSEETATDTSSDSEDNGRDSGSTEPPAE